MTEKLKVLDHHAEIVLSLMPTSREKIPGDVNKYVDKVLSPRNYFFTQESKRKMAGAIEQVAVAVLEDNFRIIPDFADKECTISNFDLICFSCPNYNAEGRLCRLDQEGIPQGDLRDVHQDTPRDDR